MKRAELLRRLTSVARRRGHDLVFVRHGGRHDLYTVDGQSVQVPRHREIAEPLARAIVRECERRGEDGR